MNNKSKKEEYVAMAEELIDAGFHALTKELGGSKEGMARLNRVREELKQIAQTQGDLYEQQYITR